MVCDVGSGANGFHRDQRELRVDRVSIIGVVEGDTGTAALTVIWTRLVLSKSADASEACSTPRGQGAVWAMIAQSLHPWRVSFQQATEIQNALASQVLRAPLPPRPRLVAGADVAYSRRTHRVYAAVVVVALPSLDTVETVGVARRASFPYIPGLLSFRELPPLLVAFERLQHRPDVVVCDGQGLAHPRRFGLACHAGLLLDLPSIGCAKTRLVGEHRTVGSRRGAAVSLFLDGSPAGAAVRTRKGVKPVFVSPGHRADIGSAVELVLALATRYRLPEPQRRAHQATVALYRRDQGRQASPARRYPSYVSTR